MTTILLGDKEILLTPEQEAIQLAATGSQESLMVDAKAGCAKTTTLQIIAKSLPVQPSLALAFNKKIKLELESRFPSHFEVKTMNGLGHQAFAKLIGKRLFLEERKISQLLKAFLASSQVELDSEAYSSILSLVRIARSQGLVPKQAIERFRAKSVLADTEASWELLADSLMLDLSDELLYTARSVLLESIIQSYKGTIDYDDQIYMSALFGGVFPRFPLVMVDEAQDLSPLNHLQVRACAAGRIIICGDPRQAIYAFRGADSSSMGTMRGLRPVWRDLPLSTTFRCPASVVARQQEHAPGFTAAPAAPQGQVVRWTERERWTAKDLLALAPLGQPIAILCRNNAPIIAAALRFIRAGHGVTVLGGEIGKALSSLAAKLLPANSPTGACIQLINAWREKEISYALANEKEERVAVIHDKADCLIAVLEECSPEGGREEMLGKMEAMFASSSLRITLATGHKSKGLEWHTVVHLDPWRVPSKWARSALQAGNPVPMEQDLNLRYVIETRTQENLVLANLDAFERTS